MTKWSLALCWLACWASTGAVAQKWTVYTPPEKDFQALFPQPPSRTAGEEGAVAFKAWDQDMEFSVYRRDPRRDRVDNSAVAVQRRLQQEQGDGRPVVRLGEEDGYPESEDYVFRVTNMMSVHRVLIAPDRYYELVVRSDREHFPKARRAAREFFGSFRATGIALAPGAATSGIAPDVLCKDRSNAFSRTFCEYRTCLQSGYEKHPYCGKLFSR